MWPEQVEKNMTLNLTMAGHEELKPRITVFGVGGAGGNAVDLVRRQKYSWESRPQRDLGPVLGRQLARPQLRKVSNRLLITLREHICVLLRLEWVAVRGLGPLQL